MKKQKILTGPELLGKLARPEVKIIDIPQLGGAVRVRPPSFREFLALKDSGLSEEEMGIQLLVMSCVDLRREDVEALQKENHGINFAALVNAVASASNPVSDDSLGKR
jgi:hypothetical protein